MLSHESAAAFFVLYGEVFSKVREENVIIDFIVRRKSV